MATPLPFLTDEQVEAYLVRLGLTARDVSDPDRTTLGRLCLAHLVRVPFENLDQVFAGGVVHDLDAALAKILAGRGGWCFELNGSFGRLLRTLGYDVIMIGCAVLLDGPSTIVEHLALEVSGGDPSMSPLLVDVGFGDSFVFPLELNRAGPQDGGNGRYEFLPSPQGTTLARLDADGVPAATLRFKRVALDFEVFAPEAHRLQSDTSLSWSTKPFASRLAEVDERLTLRHDTRSRIRPDRTDREHVTSRSAWDDTLHDWFRMARPGPWSDGATPAD